MAANQVLAELPPQSYQPALTNPAIPSKRNGHPVLQFAGSGQNESALWGVWLDSAYTGRGLTIEFLCVMASAITGDVDLDCSIERVGTTQDIDSDSFATAKSVDNISVPGTSGVPFLVSFSFLNSEIDGVLVNEYFRVKLTRDQVNDTATGFLELLDARVRES